MHDIDSTTLDFANNSFESGMNMFEAGSGDFSAAPSGETVFSEADEFDLAASLMGVTSEQELDQFLGNLLRKAVNVVRKVAPAVARVAGPVGSALKPLIKQALPSVGGALGGLFGSDALRSAGQSLGRTLANSLEMEFEGLPPDDREFETARRLVRIAGSAVSKAARNSASGPAPAVARQAVMQAVRQHVPTLANAPERRSQGSCGQWERRGNTIILYGL